MKITPNWLYYFNKYGENKFYKSMYHIFFCLLKYKPEKLFAKCRFDINECKEYLNKSDNFLKKVVRFKKPK